jgi:hypothetical protein
MSSNTSSFALKATNRTPEFLSAVESCRLKSASIPNESKQRLLQGKDANSSKRSDFARHALQISKDLQGTTAKLEKLALRAFSYVVTFSMSLIETYDGAQSLNAKHSSMTAQ